MEIDIRDQRYFCSRINSEVIITSISDPEAESNRKFKGLFFHAIDCDHKKACGVLEWSNGNKSVDWQKCVHSELNGFERLKN